LVSFAINAKNFALGVLIAARDNLYGIILNDVPSADLLLNWSVAEEFLLKSTHQREARGLGESEWRGPLGECVH
jgi:hypothetical protein